MEGESNSKSNEPAFRVLVRVRPFLERDIEVEGAEAGGGEPKTVGTITVEDNMVFLLDPNPMSEYTRQKSYAFDQVFSPTHDNFTVFNDTIKPLLISLFKGINVTCFAYGMTGAGKTHTMMGDIYHTTTEEEGICSMAIDSIFSRIEADSEKDYTVKMSYLEIYNEQVNDLLCSSIPRTSSLGLMIVDDPIKGVMVPELAEFEVTNSKELIELLLRGNSKRTMAATSVNQFSSRSHAILQIVIEFKSKTRNTVEQVLTSKLCLVDLAGSERAATSENRGIRMLEGGKINRSLLSLGNCINILSDRTRAGSSFVPYRDSKLTRLLKDSLGGNTKTVMIACVSPSSTAFEETVNTLKYAERAKRIKKKVSRNIKDVEVNIAKYSEIIASLRSEISCLKEKLNINQGQQGVTAISNPSESKISGKAFSLSSSPPQPIADREIETIDEEIQKTKELKDKYQEELNKKSEDRMLSLSHSSSLEDDEYLSKLSQELISKYEEHYEMKESIHELKNLGEENNFSLKKLGEELQLLQYQKELAPTSIEQRRYDPLIEKKKEEITQLIAVNEGNEVIKKDLEKSLEVNNEIQQKYLSLVGRLQSHKKKDILELQIAVRTLSLEKVDLMMQNLEMKKNAHISKKVEEEREKEMAQMKEELERMKEQLQLKDQQLQMSKTQIQKQSKELQNLKQQYSQQDQKSRGNTHSEAPKVRKSNPNFIKLSFRKSTERKEFSTMKISQHSPNEFKITNIKSITPLETPRHPSLADSSQSKEENKVIFGITTKRIKPRYKDLNEKGEGSFVSVSSVSMNVNEMSNSDIEVLDKCVKSLNSKNAPTSFMSRRPQAKIAHVKMEQKNINPLAEADLYGTPRSKKPDNSLKSKAQKPKSSSKKNIMDYEKKAKNSVTDSRKVKKNEGNMPATTVPINRKNNYYKEIKVVLHSGGQAQISKDRSESAHEKLPIQNPGGMPEYKSKGFFSNVSANYGTALNRLAGNRSAGSHLVEASKFPIPRDVQRNPSLKIPRSLSLRESKSKTCQVNIRINTKNRNPSVECFNNFNIAPQDQAPESTKLPRASQSDLKITVAKRNLAIPTVSIPADILYSEEAAPVPSTLSEEELSKVVSSIKQSTDKKTRLNQEIDDLIKQQKESLKQDFVKAKETEECLKMTPSIKSNPLPPAMYLGDTDEPVDWDCQ